MYHKHFFKHYGAATASVIAETLAIAKTLKKMYNIKIFSEFKADDFTTTFTTTKSFNFFSSSKIL